MIHEERCVSCINKRFKRMQDNNYGLQNGYIISLMCDQENRGFCRSSHNTICIVTCTWSDIEVYRCNIQ